MSGNTRISKCDALLCFFSYVLQLLLASSELDGPSQFFIHFINYMVNVQHFFSSDTLNFCFAKCHLQNFTLSLSLFFSLSLLDAVRKSISEASISSPHADPPVPAEPSEFPTRKLSVKSQTCQDLGSHSSTSHSAPLLSERTVCHA